MKMQVGHAVRAFPTLFRVGLAEMIAYRAEFIIWILTTNMPLVMMALWTAVAAEGPVGRFDSKAFQALLQSTQTDPSEWAYPLKDGVEVHGAAQPNAPVVEKLGGHLVRVLADSSQSDNNTQPAFLRVATPSGKTGFVAADAVNGLGGDEMCFSKDASGWKITGYFGGAGE